MRDGAIAKYDSLEDYSNLQELIDNVNSGRVNERNRNNYFKKYQQQVQDAEVKFMRAAHAIIEKYK